MSERTCASKRKMLVLMGTLVAASASIPGAQGESGSPSSYAAGGMPDAAPLMRVAVQGAARSARLGMARAEARRLDPALEEYPVVVLPANRGFHDLQEALDSCAAERSSRAATILLDAGTYTGNFTLPPLGTTIVVGRQGKFATKIVGQAGVNKAAVKVAPAAGPSSAEVIIEGLTIEASAVAAINFAGASAGAELHVEDCLLMTSSSIPGIQMSGRASTRTSV